VPVVYFFDNCVEDANGQIEALGNVLSQVMNLIRYDTGALVPQVDLVGHSMGGLIARSYLAGLQTNGSLSPPINPRVRKFIEIATPNFGSYLAADGVNNFLYGSFFGAQTREMVPASAFLWNLATWNQWLDDLRGVDALALIGNAGTDGNLPNNSDGVVSLTSASLGFSRDPSRTLILPYCHIDPATLNEAESALNTSDCSQPGIADVDNAPETGQVVRAFLENNPVWASYGHTPNQDPVLSQWGGIYFAQASAADQYLSLSKVTWGTVPLLNAGATNEFFYDEFAKGAGTFQETSGSPGTCGPFAELVGYYTVRRCKFSPVISSVTPLLPNTTARIVQSGATITINGSGFGQSLCSACQVLAGSMPLQISSWTDQTITAFLPVTYNGFAQLVVQAASGEDAINILATPPSPPVPTPAVSGVVNGASFAAGAPVAPGSIISIFGSNLATSTSFASSTPLPTELLTTSATINGVLIPLYYVSPTQINAQVPFETPPGTATLVVIADGVSSPAVTFPVTATAPGIFQDGVNRAVAQNPDGSINASNNPAKPGDVIVVYMTGQGGVSNQPPDGAPALGSPLPETLVTTTATIGGANAAAVFSGLTPGFVGLLQVNIQIPNVAAGDQPLVVTIGGAASNSALITVASQ